MPPVTSKPTAGHGTVPNHAGLEGKKNEAGQSGDAGPVHHVAVPDGAGKLGAEAALLFGQAGRARQRQRARDGVPRSGDSVLVGERELWADGPPHELFKRMRSECPVHWTARITEYPGEAGVGLQHLAILVGRQAHATVWPDIISWLHGHP